MRRVRTNHMVKPRYAGNSRWREIAQRGLQGFLPMTNTAAVLGLSGCLYILDKAQVSPLFAALLALPIGFKIGRLITREVRNEHRGH